MNSLPPQSVGKATARSVWSKRAPIALPLLCLLIFGTLIGSRLVGASTGASAAGLMPLKGYVPEPIKTSALLGSTNPNQNISISVGLQLRNVEALKAYADNAIRSRSTNKPQHLTPAQITEAFAPLANSQQAVIDYMQGYGFQVTTTDAQHLVIGFRGTVGDAENAFHVQINNYRSFMGQQFYSPANNPSVPANLASLIESIIGLNNAAHFTHKPLRPIHNAQTVATSSSVACPGPGNPQQNPNNGYIPSQIASAYNLNQLHNAGFNGEGQTVALFELDDYSQADIHAYTSCFGGGNVPIHKIPVDGGVSLNSNGGAIEVELDMELILSAAPHLAGLNVYETADNGSSQYIDTWAKIVTDAVPVVSTTWGHDGCEAMLALYNQPLFDQENSLFMLAAAQGQSIFATAGDFGTNACGAFLPPVGSPKLGVDDPASQPYVTAVGGTSLVVKGTNTYGGEAAWNDGDIIVNKSSGEQIVWAGGGGISSQWTMPSWQQGPGVINSYSSGTPCGASNGSYCREVPDVSLNADPYTGYEEYCTQTFCFGGWFSIGGTSAATPMWAAFMALANEKTLHDGGFNIGFLNPYLYQIDQGAGGTSYANDFHDITAGNNDGLADGQNIYPATADYDMATGLGSYNAWNLANDLEKLANTTNGSRGAPTAKTWYFAEGMVGNTYKEYLTILNPSTSVANVTVQYFFQGGKAPLSVTHSIPANIRYTVNVNNDLGIAVTGPQTAVAAVVTSDVPVGVERPIYFNAHGVASGTDVLGATSPNTSFYFANADSRSTSQEFLEVLNPQTAAANLTVTYVSNGQVVESDHVSVPTQQRATFSPTTFHGQASIQVTSDQPVVVERSEYFSGNVPNAGGQTTGAAATMGVTTQASDWLFAEGYTGSNFQENLVLANFAAAGTAPVTATIRLEYTNGTVQTVTQQINAQSQVVFDVNNANRNPNCSPSSTPACTVSNSVSIEVTSTAPIVAERVQYFHFGLDGHMYPGMDDVVGQVGPASQSTYGFFEGSAGTNFLDWLTLQNPNSTSVVAAITVFTDNTIVQKEITLPAHSRTSLLLNDIVNPLVAAYPNPTGYTVSMDVQSFGGPIVAERPLYFTFNNGTGASDIIGYTGQ